MVEFGSHPGYAHIIENEEIFPRNFAEVKYKIHKLSKLFFL